MLQHMYQPYRTNQGWVELLFNKTFLKRQPTLNAKGILTNQYQYINLHLFTYHWCINDQTIQTPNNYTLHSWNMHKLQIERYASYIHTKCHTHSLLHLCTHHIHNCITYNHTCTYYIIDCHRTEKYAFYIHT